MAGTLIHTERGLIPIEDVNVSDRVLTHTNSYQRVLAVGNRDNAPLVKVRGMCFKDILCTPNHPFYVRKKFRYGHKSERRFAEPEWLEAEKLTKDYYIGYAINQKSEFPKWDGVEIQKNQSLVVRENNLSEKFSNPSFWYLLGRYIGDGWQRENNSKGIVICCGGRNEQRLVSAISEAGFVMSKVKERTVIKYFIYGTELLDFVKRYDKYAYGKTIDEETINLPKEFLRHFLDGIIDSDGCWNISDRCWQLTTTSESLAYGVQQCVAKVYSRPCSIIYQNRPKHHTIEGRVVNQRGTFMLRWHSDKRKQDKAFFEDGIIWFPLTDVSPISETAKVYNMEVEKDNSYTANGAIVHNCQSVSTAGKQAGMKKDSGAESALIWATEDCIRAVNPEVIIYENVKGMISKRNKPDFDDWCATLDRLGYVVQYQVLNSKNFGVAQNRERVFPIAIRKDLPMAGKYEYPQGFPLMKCVEDYMESVENISEEYFISKDRITNKVLSDILDQPNVKAEFENLYHAEHGKDKVVCVPYILFVSAKLVKYTPNPIDPYYPRYIIDCEFSIGGKKKIEQIGLMDDNIRRFVGQSATRV